MRRFVIWGLLLALLGLLVFAIWQWNTTHFSLTHWSYVHFGIVGSGGYYGFWSGTGSDIGEVVLIGSIITLIVGLWRKVNCHTEGCYRIGIHHVAGGQYVVCRKHHNEITGHPHRKLSIEHLRRMHEEHCAPQPVQVAVVPPPVVQVAETPPVTVSQ